MKIGDLVVTERGIEQIMEMFHSGVYSTKLVVSKEILLECKEKWFDTPQKVKKLFKKEKKVKKAERRELERKLRIQIAADVEDKMAYMGTCLNEQNIILGIIRGHRQFNNSLCAVCNSTTCELKLGENKGAVDDK